MKTNKTQGLLCSRNEKEVVVNWKNQNLDHSMQMKNDGNNISTQNIDYHNQVKGQTLSKNSKLVEEGKIKSTCVVNHE